MRGWKPKPGDHLIDTGCGVGGPARSLAHCFGCRVDGIDITEPSALAANHLSELTGLRGRVMVRLGDGHSLPYLDRAFGCGSAQHVTINVAGRAGFFDEAFRGLRPGAFFALTEHGLGDGGRPHHPVPRSTDGDREYLMTPEEPIDRLRGSGFDDIRVTETGGNYLAGYRKVMALAKEGELPPLPFHILAPRRIQQPVTQPAISRRDARGRCRSFAKNWGKRLPARVLSSHRASGLSGNSRSPANGVLRSARPPQIQSAPRCVN